MSIARTISQSANIAFGNGVKRGRVRRAKSLPDALACAKIFDKLLAFEVSSPVSVKASHNAGGVLLSLDLSHHIHEMLIKLRLNNH